jgi:alpha-ketoglutarate-dependent taurine dioxygenase
MDNPRPSTLRRRSAVTVDGELVDVAPLDGFDGLAAQVVPRFPDVDLAAWIAAARGRIDELLLRYPALLFRGFSLRSVDEFDRVAAATAPELLDYVYGSTPRRREGGNVYSSTEYPAQETIPLHNEMSYTTSWPMKLWFCCLVPAATGGQTPLADSRLVLSAIPADVVERFERHGVAYVRNYGGGLDLPWQDVFQTSERAAVERFCADRGIAFEWRGGDRLWTRQVCQATTVHPRSGERTWFNQAHLFHISALPDEVRAPLLSAVGEEGLPRNATYGDGSPIGEELEAVRAAFRAAERAFDWLAGDAVLVDNVLAAHGRRPYSGRRKVVVAMAESATPFQEAPRD